MIIPDITKTSSNNCFQIGPKLAYCMEKGAPIITSLVIAEVNRNICFKTLGRSKVYSLLIYNSYEYLSNRNF